MNRASRRFSSRILASQSIFSRLGLCLAGTLVWSSMAMSQPETPAEEMICGGRLEHSVTLSRDLVCDVARERFALSVINDDPERKIIIDGNGHKITTARGTGNGLYLKGPNILVTNLKISGFKSGIGLSAYNTPDLALVRSEFETNKVGVSIFAEGVFVKPRLENLVLRGNLQFGVQIQGAVPTDTQHTERPAARNCIEDVNISNSSFLDNVSYAVVIEADHFKVRDADKNLIQGNFAYYLKGGDFDVENYHSCFVSSPHCPSPTASRVSMSMFFFDSARSAKLRDCTIGLPVGTLSTDHEQLGINFYATANVRVESCEFTGGDVGARISLPGQDPSTVVTDHILFSSNRKSGFVHSASFATPFAKLTRRCLTAVNEPPTFLMEIFNPGPGLYQSITDLPCSDTIERP